jgi:hypothetical protein
VSSIETVAQVYGARPVRAQRRGHVAARCGAGAGCPLSVVRCAQRKAASSFLRTTVNAQRATDNRPLPLAALPASRFNRASFRPYGELLSDESLHVRDLRLRLRGGEGRSCFRHRTRDALGGRAAVVALPGLRRGEGRLRDDRSVSAVVNGRTFANCRLGS